MLFNNKYTINIEYILKRKRDLRWIMVLISWFFYDVNLRQNCKKNLPEMNMLNKNARNKKITIKSLVFLGRKQAQGCILRGWGLKW